MTEHLSLFDPEPLEPPAEREYDSGNRVGRERGRQLRDEAINRVEDHNTDAADALYAAAIRAGERFGLFTADDVWDEADLHVREPRVMGAVMRRLKKDGVAVPTDRVRQAHRGINHARPQTVWRRCL